MNNTLPKYRQPFWLPASSFYILAIAISIAFFFLVWGILQEGDEPMPWIPAGIGASLVLVGAVLLREIVLRKARNRFLRAQKKLDYNLDGVTRLAKAYAPEKKLSLERNAQIIKQIQKKSEAARVLMKLSDGHLEVAEICREYLEINKQEFENVGVGSPRLAALRRGKEIVEELHKFHLLTWAETETRALTREAKNRVTVAEKIETAQKALDVLESALFYYPDEHRLSESEEAVREFIISIRVGHWIEQAERAAFKGNKKRAISHYKDALYFLARENPQNKETDLIAEKINGEIEKLKESYAEKKILKNPDSEREV